MDEGLTAEAPRAPIHTRRCIMRLPVASDLPAIRRLINDPAIARNAGLIRYPYPAISGRGWIASAHAAAGPSFHMPYLLTLRSNPRLIAGAAGISVVENGIATIGYWVARPCRRRGFASEAARALVELAFTRCWTAAVRASARPSNAASQRVPQAAGMRRAGRSRIKSIQLGRYVPAFAFRLDRITWGKVCEHCSQ